MAVEEDVCKCHLLLVWLLASSLWKPLELLAFVLRGAFLFVNFGAGAVFK